MVDKVLISEIKAISFQILFTIFICDQFYKNDNCLNDKGKTQNYYVSKFQW